MAGWMYWREVVEFFIHILIFRITGRAADVLGGIHLISIRDWTLREGVRDCDGRDGLTGWVRDDMGWYWKFSCMVR